MTRSRPGPVPAVAEVRVAVRRLLTAERPAAVLVACSGGADSVALAAATAFEAPKLGIPAGLVTVDHGLQPGSAQRAVAVAALGRRLGLDPVEIRTVTVGTGGGPEAAARIARRTALLAARDSAARVLAALDPPAGGLAARDDDAPAGVRRVAVSLGHTLDDQAETVLLGLGRGSGPRSIAGMRPVDGPWLRPLLGVRRATTRAACAAEGLDVWEDPHNADPRFTRVRLRTEVLPLLEDVLSGGVAEALARTADLVRDDLDALDALSPPVTENTLDADALAGLPPAVRRRALRVWLRAGGVPPVTAAHVKALEALVTGWHGQGPVALPSGLEAVRRSGRLHLADSATRTGNGAQLRR